MVILDFPSGKVPTSFRAHSENLGGVAFSPDGTLLATCSENGEAKLWETTTWKEKAVLRGHLLGVYALAFSPDGRRLATASSWKEAVKLWDVVTGQEIAVLEGQGDAFDRVMFSADGRMIAAAGLGGVVNLWRAPTWSEISLSERVTGAIEARK